MRRDINNGSAVDYQLQSAYRYQDAREAREDGYYSYARVSAAAAYQISRWALEAMNITDSDQEYA